MKIPKFSTLLKYHILLGVLLIFIPQLFIVHLYVFLGVYISLLFASLGNFQKFKHYFLIGFLYFPLSEAVGRLHHLDPFVPWEFGKYMAIFFVMVLLFSGKMVLGWRFALGCLLIITTILNGNTTWKLVFFNAIVTFCIMLMGDFFKNIKINGLKFLYYLRFSILPLIVFFFSSISQLQNFKAEDIRLNSNSVLDGIPSNQVSTYMGLGFLLLVMFFRWKIEIGTKLGHKLVIAFGMLAVGLISFSRGGIIAGITGAILLYFSNIKDLLRFRYLKQILLITPFILASVFFINNKTNGKLFLRYQGETEGTLAGSKEKGINTLTTNRYNIMLGDLYLFENNILLGVSTGRSKDYRNDTEGQLSHLEFSRLLAEHGIAGMLVLLFWIKDFFSIRGSYMGQLKMALFFVGVATTFHGAMRTSVPLVFMLISLITTLPNKNNSLKNI
jgi:hypothetical protein